MSDFELLSLVLLIMTLLVTVFVANWERASAHRRVPWSESNWMYWEICLC